MNDLNRSCSAVFVAFLLNALSISAMAPRVDETGRTYTYDWESLKQKPVPQWFEDAKFGIFIHWGPYSVIGYTKGNRGYAEHVPKQIYRDPEHYYPLMKERFGAHPPEFGYKDIVPLFTAENWDPDAWAQLFHDAGARYVVLTAEHHDGYALWDSDLTPWNAMDMGPKRDLVGDLGKAVRKFGMKYAPSSHRDRHNGFFALERFLTNNTPHPDIAKEIERMPEAELLYGPFVVDEAFVDDFVARWKEIETKYQPDFMWLDHNPMFHKRWNAEYDHPAILRYREACMEMIADYYNVAETWGKEVYVNNKGKPGLQNWPIGVGCREEDNMHVDDVGMKWQNPATLGTSYGYMEWEEKNDAYKSPAELVHLLCDVVSKNGNLLLNIGPRADGTIPQGMQTRLLAMGEWLRTNGEAIYGTRPWVVANQKGDPSTPEIVFTTKGDTLYAIAFDQHEQPFFISLPKGQEDYQISDISLLGSPEEIEWSVSDKGIRIVAPEQLPGEHAWTFKIERFAKNPE